VNPLFLFLPVAALLFQPALVGYEIAASVGVWRSGNRLIAAGGAGAGKVVAAKIAAVVLIAAQALLLLRMFAFLVRYRGAL
jgi:hypothetical protein